MIQFRFIQPCFLDVALLAQQLFTVSEIVAWLTMFVGFLLSLLFCRSKQVPLYMRSLPLYFFVNCLSEIVGSLFLAKDNVKYNYLTYTLFELLYFMYFYTKLLPSFKKLHAVIGTAIVLVPTVIAFALTNDRIATKIGLWLEALVVLVPCSFYVNRILSTHSSIPPEKDPGFWMVTGIYAYFVVLIPVYSFSAYYSMKHDTYLSAGVYSVQNFALVISYILFTKAMTCPKKSTC